MTISAPSGKVVRSKTTDCSSPDIVCRSETRHPRKNPSLGHVLNYRNNAVVAKMRTEYKLSERQARQLFDDTLKFLWLANKFGGLEPPKVVDDGWHTFILFTMDYQKFCHKYFGRFMHHRPYRPEDPVDDGSGTKRSMALISEHLGDKLSKNWDNPSTVVASCQGGGKGCKSKCRQYCKCNGE